MSRIAWKARHTRTGVRMLRGMNPQTRRTSLYTAHVGSGAVETAATALTAAGVPLQDVGDYSVAYRAPDDAKALQIAAQALDGPCPGWTMTTGLGVHRRPVAHEVTVTSRPDGSYDGRCACGSAMLQFTRTNIDLWATAHERPSVPA